MLLPRLSRTALPRIDYVFNNRPRERKNRRDQKHAGNGSLHESHELPMAHHERTAEVRFHHIAEEQSEHKGSRREIIYFAHKAEKSSDKHDDNVEKIIIKRIGADDAQKTYRRPNGRL